jgi:hypothetical protein
MTGILLIMLIAAIVYYTTHSNCHLIRPRKSEVPIAEFSDATLTNGDTIQINLDRICTMQRFPDETIIHFDHSISVKETPIEIRLPTPFRAG